MHFETPRDRENRIRETWLDLKRKNALMGPDARTTEEQLALQEEIVERCRALRWKMDQELIKENVEPIFKFNYRNYTAEDFMVDSAIEFSKLKHFLSHNPGVLKENNALTNEYEFIKKLMILEHSGKVNDPDANIAYNEILEKYERRQREIEMNVDEEDVLPLDDSDFMKLGSGGDFESENAD